MPNERTLTVGINSATELKIDVLKDEYRTKTRLVDVAIDRLYEDKRQKILYLVLWWLEGINLEPGGAEILARTQPEGFCLNDLRKIVAE